MTKQMLALAACCAVVASMAAAQTAATPAQTPPTVAAPQPGAQSGAPLPPIKFPAVELKNFTATSPSPETVDAFLHQVWGSDENREWRVAAIQPASVPGFVKVLVYVADKREPTHIVTSSFLVTPDGKHVVAGEISPFGATPFAGARATLQQHADGPSFGAPGKELELVEFSDLQCSSCKAAQATVDQLAKDLPQAHIVYQSFPQTAAHPYALLAAEVGHCVRQAKGDPVFFVYAQKVLDTQADLVAGKADATLRAAVTAAGADPATVMACAVQPAARAAIESSVKLAASLDIPGVPTLVANGRALPLVQVPYAALKKLIVFQGKLDGIDVHEQPSLTTLK